MSTKPDRGDGEALEQLADTLALAVELSRELSGDTLLARLISVFNAMPADDRPVVISVLEREVLSRHLSQGTEKAVGQATHVNPNARLYVRSHDTNLDHRHFDVEQMHVANVRAMRIATVIRHIPTIYALWKESLRSAMDEVDEPTRAVAAELLRDGLAAIAYADAARPAADPTPQPAESATRERPRRS